MTQHQNQPHRTLLRTGFSVLFLAFSLLLTHSANAISCAIPTPKKAFLSSDLVFLATATNLKKKQMKYFQFYSNWKEWNPSNKDQIITVYSVKLNVKKVWKGSPGKILNYEWGSLSWGGYSFSEGVTFLIYAQQQKGEISTHW